MEVLMKLMVCVWRVKTKLIPLRTQPNTDHGAHVDHMAAR